MNRWIINEQMKNEWNESLIIISQYQATENNSYFQCR